VAAVEATAARGWDWRRWVGGLGRTLIAAGTLILLFVAYQLWGTGLAEARSQRALEREFEQLFPNAPAAPPSTVAGAPTTSTTFPDAPPPAPEGQAIAVIRIPRLSLEKHVVQGVNLSDLKKAPGHYPQTPMPGQPGNAAIAGHRTTYGAPFYSVDELQRDDKIFVTTAQGAFEYRVRETKVVRPNEVQVLDPTPDNRLTLTTCHPRFSARQRMIVVAELIGPAAPGPPPGSLPAPSTDPDVPGDDPVVGSEAPTGFEGGLSGEDASRGPAVLWGIIAALVAFGVWALSRRWRRWPAYVLGTPVFLVVLFVFFENFSRLLPANF
jgi:sortase A